MVVQESITAFRFGYGLRPGEPSSPPEAMLAGVARGGREAAGRPSTLAEREAAFDRILQVRGKPGMEKTLAEARQAVDAQLAADRSARIATAVLSPDGFYERLVWFWTDHFAISAALVDDRRLASITPTFEVDAIRPHVAGSFAALLRAAVKHPAMMKYLGQNTSYGPNSKLGRERGRGLNENLAREILELHTLGVGANYNQIDVREFAELLTGLTIDSAAGRMAFQPERAEPGTETILGKTYGGAPIASHLEIDAVLDDLAVHPATARHIARKLATHFVADEPDPDLVAHLEKAFRLHDGDLMAVYAALLEHPASWNGIGSKVRQPFDFVVASLRATGPADVADLALGDPPVDPVAALTRMNQPIWEPPGPDGWPEAAGSWISPPGLTARIEWASQLGVVLEPRIDPRTFVDVALGPLARKETRSAVRSAAERWEGIALVLASPEFNRR
jgi:uncharacterized protein (DUF1800 family)